MNFEIVKSNIDGLLHIIPKVYGDNRGYFMESYNHKTLSELGFDKVFVQDNESMSKKGVLRGLHFQTKHTQGKLVRCTYGRVLDVAVDLRAGSPTYGKWESVILDSKKKNMFYVPVGFAHGFLVISDVAVFNYKCTDYYAPEYDSGIRWDDSDINIAWEFEKYGITEPLISDKDSKLPYLRNAKIVIESEFK